MKTRILLVNFTEKEQEIAALLGINVDLGYLSDAFDTIDSEGSREQRASFYSPLAIYEYKVIFIRLTKTPPLEYKFKDEAKIISEKDRVNFLRYWYENKGVLVIFAEDCNFSSLKLLGIPDAKLVESNGNDKTISFALEIKERLLRITFEEMESLVFIPPFKYVEVNQYESKSTGKNWSIFPAYVNRNDEKVGIYFNWGYSFSDTDTPAFLILPAFKNYSEVITKLLKTFARIYPKYISEIVDGDWIKSDKYYPKEISTIDEAIKQIISDTESKIEAFRQEKLKAKEKYSHLCDLLTESGDKLKKAVIKTLTDVFKLQVEDMDKTKKTEFREDILIKDSSFPPVLTEIKGTKNSYPSFTYVTQVFSNLLKGRDKYPNAIGGLILNYDLTRDPEDRAEAFTNSDEENQLKEIIYIDTRILFELSLAVIDYKMSITEANDILLQKGRVNFNLDKYIKESTSKNEK